MRAARAGRIVIGIRSAASPHPNPLPKGEGTLHWSDHATARCLSPVQTPIRRRQPAGGEPVPLLLRGDRDGPPAARPRRRGGAVLVVRGAAGGRRDGLQILRGRFHHPRAGPGHRLPAVLRPRQRPGEVLPSLRRGAAAGNAGGREDGAMLSGLRQGVVPEPPAGGRRGPDGMSAVRRLLACRQCLGRPGGQGVARRGGGGFPPPRPAGHGGPCRGRPGRAARSTGSARSAAR